MKVHDFQSSLAYSHAQSDQPWWGEVYRRAFPDMVGMADLREDGWHQRAGRDRAIVLSSGRTVYVDEKVRTEVYDDIAIEIWSQYPLNGQPPYRPVPEAKEGWARKPLDCDWLAYAFVPTATCHLLPFLGIRAAMEKSRMGWIRNADAEENGFRWIVAPNRRYQTISIAVPIWILRGAIEDAMTITWTTSEAAA